MKQIEGFEHSKSDGKIKKRRSYSIVQDRGYCFKFKTKFRGSNKETTFFSTELLAYGTFYFNVTRIVMILDLFYKVYLNAKKDQASFKNKKLEKLSLIFVSTPRSENHEEYKCIASNHAFTIIIINLKS
ncbi:hypothetical protein BpHYR1_034957 [Brachionus plicatilis]|uniref:Uncharacterized protein n=1 Tax=Brachionus plicatilis TaxID=10195 RepID=A0A3M7PNZ5_BRAPC|nr:hypothetical protein BpHYR1_034957 [Brachionus plicatilis]